MSSLLHRCRACDEEYDTVEEAVECFESHVGNVNEMVEDFTRGTASVVLHR